MRDIAYYENRLAQEIEKNKELTAKNARLITALKVAKALGHSSDCIDQDEPLEGDESCECGYSIIEQTLEAAASKAEQKENEK